MTQSLPAIEEVVPLSSQTPSETCPKMVRRDLWRGLKAVSPLLPGVLPFAMIAGSSAVEAGLSTAAALGMSLFIFAGASQLVMVEMWDREAPALVLLATVLLVNLRFSMYSAMLAPFVRGWKLSRKTLMAYLLTDQAALLSTPEFKRDSISAKYFFTGAALTLWVTWQSGTMIGVFLGVRLPESWSLDFAVPLSFLALLIPAIHSRGTAIAAVTAGAAVLLTRLLPFNLGLIVATLLGVFAAMLFDRRAT